jgi:hypothetical protein
VKLTLVGMTAEAAQVEVKLTTPAGAP